MRNSILFFSLSVLLVLNSCKKEETSDNQPLYEYRLSSLVLTVPESQPTVSASYTYENNKLMKITQNLDGEPVWISDVTYPDSHTAEVVETFLENSSWVVDTKTVYTYTDNQTSSTSTYSSSDGTYSLESQSTYIYDGAGQVSDWERSSYKDGEAVFTSKHNYSYEEGLRVSDEFSELRDDNWVVLTRTTYQYEGQLLVSSLNENFNGTDWHSYSREEFEYESNKVHTIEFFLFNNDVWQLEVTRTYIYDQEGNLLKSEGQSSDGSLFDMLTYTYEKNPGNLYQFSNKALFDFGAPDPYYGPAVHVRSPNKLCGSFN